MSRPTLHPPGSRLTRPEVDAVCRHAGLPHPTGVAPVGPAWVHANFRLSFARGPDLLLRRVVASPGYDTLHNELAALQIARRIEGLPIVGAYRILPAGLIPGQAALTSFLPGTPSRDLGPEATGRVMRQLGDVALDAFGLQGDGGRFVATAPSWREEWRRHADGLAATARAAGYDPGGLVDAAVARIDAHLDALERARFTLVHGDLHPRNLLFLPDGQLSGVVDWEAASAGDPLCEWSGPLETSPPTLAAVVRGFGAEAVRELLEPEPLARITVYVWTRQLLRLAFCGRGVFAFDHGRRRAMMIEHTRRHHEATLPDGALRHRLERALDQSRAPSGRGWRPTPTTGLLRRALERLRHTPSPRGPALLRALAAGLIAARVDDPDPWVARGDALLDDLGDPQVVRRGPAPPWDALVARGLHAPSALSLTALTLVGAAAHRLRETPSDGVRQGLVAWLPTLTLEAIDADVLVAAAIRRLVRAGVVLPEGIRADLPASRTPDPTDELLYLAWLEGGDDASHPPDPAI